MVTILPGTCSFFLPSWSSFNRPSAEINRNAQNVTKCPTPGSSWISSSRQMTAEQHPNNVVAISGNAIFLEMKKKFKFVLFSLFCFFELDSSCWDCWDKIEGRITTCRNYNKIQTSYLSTLFKVLKILYKNKFWWYGKLN